jgi:IrrE N-terminal-like domain
MIEGSNSMLPDPEILANQILEVTGQQRAPTDVRAIVSKWPHLSVVETELDGDGLFVDLGVVGGEILVKKSKHETRKRFTLAHELGHFLVRHHIREKSERREVENWCNKFAAELLLPKLLVSQHLKSGGLSHLTERLHHGPTVFQVSEKAFYLRVTRLFPISIFNVLLSGPELYVIDEYHSRHLEEYTAEHSTVFDIEIKTLLAGLVAGNVGQHQLKRYDRTWLARRVYKESVRQKFLLISFESMRPTPGRDWG